MRATRIGLFVLCITAMGCDDGWHEDEPVDRAVTAWRLVPGLDDRRVAITLEPRMIHRDEQGVLTLGYSSQIVGPSIAVEHDTPFATLDLGSTEVRTGATRSWILQTETSYWEHMFPADSPPRAPFVRATIVDRATFAMTAVTFDPPVEVPVVIGDALLDVSPAGVSDIERDVVVRARASDGTATVLHAGRGFGAASCARGGGLVVAYQQQGGALHLVSVRPAGAGAWGVAETTLPGLVFDPLGIACNDAATHVAVVVPAGIWLVEIATGTVVVRADGLQRPMVVATDGTAIVGARTTDRVLVHADATTTTVLAAVSAKDPERPVVAGDLAMFELEKAVAVIDVATGALGTVIPAIRDYMYPFEMVRWRDKFVVQLSTFPATTYDDTLEQMWLVDQTTATSLPLPAERSSPALFVPGDSTLYLRVYDDAADPTPRLVSLDVAAATLLTDEPLPLCDDTEVLEGRGCR